MKVDPTSSFINPSPCSLEDVIAEFPVIAKVIEEVAGGGSFVDSHKVKITTNDTTESFLIDAMVTTDTLDPVADIIVSAATNGASGTNQKMDVFIHTSDIAGYSGSGSHALCQVDGVPTYVDTSSFGGGGGVDDKTVKVSAADTASEYLHTSMKDPGTYAANDVIISAAITDAASNEKLRNFIDLSAVTGYTGTGYVLWTLANGVFTFDTLNSFSDTLFNTITLVNLEYDAGDFTLTAPEQFRLIRGTATSNVGESDDTFFITSVEPLARGKDPSGGNPTAFIEVRNFFHKRFALGEWVQAVWSEGFTRWETLRTPNDGSNGSSGTFLCTLTTDANPCSGTSILGSCLGTVYDIQQGGGLDLIGERTVFNPYLYELPAAGGSAHYACAKTYTAPDEEEGDDEYTILGPDILYYLAHINGFAANKVLFTSGTSVSNIVWAGGPC